MAAMLTGCADPEAAAGHLVRLREAADRAGIRLPPSDDLALLVPLLTCQAPAARLIAHPRLARWLVQTRYLDDEKPARIFDRELRGRARALASGEELDRLLRRYRNRELARIALRDLTRRAPLRVVVREVSHLADALVATALSFWDAQLATRFGARLGAGFCVIAMGKHGAEELNYSSDIDVLFLLDQDGRMPSGGSRRDHAVALAQAMIRSLSAITPDGFAFRVDANLRPYGRDGPLAQTLDEMERYYERAGQTWERAALIKARPCAGGLDLGQELLARLRPFVYRRAIDLAAVGAVAEMKRRIDREQARSPRDNVKLGRGGIREIEFFVQALQLLHGGRQPSLRVRSTLTALEALLYGGLLPAQDQLTLAEAYVFLRDTEHRLQLPNDRQTQLLPEADELGARRALANRMGFTDVGPFDAALARHRRAVHELFAGLLVAAADEKPPRPEAELALHRDASDAARGEALGVLGFQHADKAVAELKRLQRLPESAMGARGRERHPGLAERLLEEMARSPDPDLALAQFLGLFSPMWHPAAATELLASNPATARLLILLFGSSETLTRDLQMHPELLDLLVRSDAAITARSRGAIELAARERLSRAEGIEEQLGALRILRRDETLRIGLMDLAGQLDSAAVGAQLTELAEVLLGRVCDLSRQEIAAKYGEPPGASFAVLAFGSFGGEELDYESDLDLVFVYDAAGHTTGGPRGSIDATEWAARVSQRLLSHLTLPSAEGVLYRVDARLRPSGSQGPLVTSLEAFSRYHGAHEDGPAARGAALWERQALLRARGIAGDEALCDAVSIRTLDAVAAQPAPPDVGAQIAEMRFRLDAVGPGGGVYPKKGPGGLLDIEFLTQFLQIQHGIRVPSTRRALDRLIGERWLDEEIGHELQRSYELLRRVESRLRLLYWRPDVFVPPSGPGLTRLARQLGDAGADAGPRLLRDLNRCMARVREVFREIVR